MRVAILWTGMSGYLNACLKELASRESVELFVTHQAPVQDAPFDDSHYAWISNRLVWRSQADLTLLDERLRAFDPEILLFAGWHVPPYRRVARSMAKHCWRVLAFDNPWEATLRQRVGTLVAPWYIRPLADMIWIPGERQAAFARRLGFELRSIIWGSLSCDQPGIETVHLTRQADGRPLPHVFLFVGEFASHKGVDQLVEAYSTYRQMSRDPWPLICCGAGPLGARFKDRPGICVEGFVQPDRLNDILASAGCLILPSSMDHWGVVIHEAASAGLVILASEIAGAAVHLVQDNYNGYIFDGRNPKELAALMAHVSNLSEARLDAMSQASHLLSKQFSPARWADTILQAHNSFSSH
ncbi:MAG TPA: glycosyltransferase [Terracidiphilus sp.]|jgi:glycosyltransferase involved in cell wall biosynthesis